MTDLDTLQRALRAPAPGLGRLPIGEIMVRGRRLRRRRQALAAGGLACLAAVLAAAGIGASHLGRHARPAPPLPITARHSPPRPAGAYGAVVRTGIRNGSRELVFYAVHLHLRQLPGDTFGLMGAFQDPAGHLSGAVASNEVTGSDVAAGFHAVEAPLSGMPEFGYYAGPVAKITGRAGGHTVRAALARWSVNRTVVIFWFRPADDPHGLDVTGLKAFGAHGKRLPGGNSVVGHG